jgi:hypothetical protein
LSTSPLKLSFELPPRETQADIDEKRERILGDRDDLAKKLDVALHVINLEKKIFEATHLQHEVHFDADYQARRARFDLLRWHRKQNEDAISRNYERHAAREWTERVERVENFENKVIGQARRIDNEMAKYNGELERRLERS